MKLKNKVAIITGGGSGIGQATAILFAKEGAKVVVSDIIKEKADETVKMIEEEGYKNSAVAVKADVSKEKEVEEMVKKTVESFGAVDILVNNAGAFSAHQITETTAEEWNNLFNVNLFGPFLCCKYALPHMIAKEKGKIINVSSIGGVISLQGSGPYSATKGGLISFTKSLSLDYAAKGINANCICPGWTRTPMTQALMDDPNISKAFLADIPYGKFAKPEDQANLILWLASEDADYMHGATIINDGGWTTR